MAKVQDYNKMGVCQPDSAKYDFTASFTAHLRNLFEYYQQTVEFLRHSGLFQEASPELHCLVSAYLRDTVSFARHDAGLCAIDAVHRLHPVDYGTARVTHDWLVEACLRQQKFIDSFPLGQLDFRTCYIQYVDFLYLCSKNRRSVTVPNKMADFMWHAHMLDHYRYKFDSTKMLGFVLNHDDAIPEQALNEHAKQTSQLRAKVAGQVRPPGSKQSSMIDVGGHSYPRRGCINYNMWMVGEVSSDEGLAKRQWAGKAPSPRNKMAGPNNGREFYYNDYYYFHTPHPIFVCGGLLTCGGCWNCGGSKVHNHVQKVETFNCGGGREIAALDTFPQCNYKASVQAANDHSGGHGQAGGHHSGGHSSCGGGHSGCGGDSGCGGGGCGGGGCGGG